MHTMDSTSNDVVVGGYSENTELFGISTAFIMCYDIGAVSERWAKAAPKNDVTVMTHVMNININEENDNVYIFYCESYACSDNLWGQRVRLSDGVSNGTFYRNQGLYDQFATV